MVPLAVTVYPGTRVYYDLCIVVVCDGVLMVGSGYRGWTHPLPLGWCRICTPTLSERVSASIGYQRCYWVFLLPYPK